MLKSLTLVKTWLIVALLVMVTGFATPVLAMETQGITEPMLFQPAQRNYALRIINGVDTGEDEFPWVVSIGTAFGSSSNLFQRHFCGGSYIGDQWVLTAAHCILDANNNLASPFSINVTVGDRDLRNIADLEVLNVSNVIPHPDYTGNVTQGADIALLKLSRSPSIPTVKLTSNPSELDDAGVSSTTIGWGITEEDELSPILQKVNVPVVSNAICNAPESYNGRIQDDMICAGFEEGGKDACQGDSGGPLIAMANGSPELTGVVSWGAGCAQENKYGVYTRVAKYVDWVATTTGIDLSSPKDDESMLDILKRIEQRLTNIEDKLPESRISPLETPFSEYEPYEGPSVSETDLTFDRAALERSISGYRNRIDNWPGLPNFSGREVTSFFSNRCGGHTNSPPPRDIWNRFARTLVVLQKLRTDLGAPITLTSVYRDPTYNRCVGGVTGSEHTKNLAIDFTSSTGNPRRWASALKSYRGRTFTDPATGGSFVFKGGIGTYVGRNFVHIDTNGTNRDWDG
ncbi:MAG: trypsin-like serine protease [Crocosphaera sp.]|nr:trypsin-like serine protease [Crocosphaera sp.]